eukprot:TRINITY_DN53721_c0_g1_i1.p1 TRINITY_DN53721_c0_g1~~TRINITY_DN53721_c0_g1_i1.p1  ORF type:complete len:353 (+),score=94.33 TRINITY_DN53721_c0_g1_i1:69-1127(+)
MTRLAVLLMLLISLAAANESKSEATSIEAQTSDSKLQSKDEKRSAAPLNAEDCHSISCLKAWRRRILNQGSSRYLPEDYRPYLQAPVNSRFKINAERIMKERGEEGMIENSAELSEEEIRSAPLNAEDCHTTRCLKAWRARITSASYEKYIPAKYLPYFNAPINSRFLINAKRIKREAEQKDEAKNKAQMKKLQEELAEEETETTEDDSGKSKGRKERSKKSSHPSDFMVARPQVTDGNTLLLATSDSTRLYTEDDVESMRKELEQLRKEKEEREKKEEGEEEEEAQKEEAQRAAKAKLEAEQAEIRSRVGPTIVAFVIFILIVWLWRHFRTPQAAQARTSQNRLAANLLQS